MDKKKIIKWGLILGGIGIVAAVSIALYIYYQPHRDVQSTPVDYNLEVQVFVDEYLNDADAANQKYLAEDGDSKILAITGTVNAISEDDKGRVIITLIGNPESAGVSCTFLETTSANAKALKEGDKTTIKGVVKGGPEYDEDMEIYTDAIMQDCDILKK